MLLTKKEGELFFPTINGLIERAGARLIGSGELSMPDTPEEDRDTTAKVLDRLWSDATFLDSVAADWPGLTSEQRALIGTWHHAYRTHYIATVRDTQAYFLADGYAFVVSGLEKPIEKQLKFIPSFVETTLLPFRDKIVYDTALFEYSVNASANMTELIENDLDRLISEGRLLKTGDDLVRLEPTIRAEAEKSENERVVREAEEAMHADDVPGGFHAGMLAGLEGEQRESAMLNEEEEADLKRTFAQYHFEALLDSARKGEPRHALVDLLMFETKDRLCSYARAFRLTGYSKLRKRELAEALAETVGGDVELVDTMLGALPTRQIDILRGIIDEGGTRVVAPEDIGPGTHLPDGYSFFCYLFEEGGKLVIVVPDEIVALGDRLDWEGARAYADDAEKAIGFVDATVRLRGVANLADLSLDYAKRYPEGLDVREFVPLVFQAVRSGQIGCDLLVPDETASRSSADGYVLAFELADAYRDDQRVPDQGPIIRGRLEDTVVSDLIDEQSKVEPRPLMPGVDSSLDLEDWILERPAVRALRGYLDAHVPDGQSDRAFADNVMSELIDYMETGFRDAQTVREWLDILEDHGFVPTEAMANRVIELLMNAANAIPQWPNNGWSAKELRDRESEDKLGRKIFYDENGKPMKIGRNDPCPCGSGKKYKNCHGKR